MRPPTLRQALPALALLLAVGAAPSPVLAGHETPALPGGVGQSVNLGPGDASTSVASSSTSSGATTSNAIEDRLAEDAVKQTFSIAGDELSPRTLLDKWGTLGQDDRNLADLKRQVDADIEIANLRLGVDFFTRRATRELDAKYVAFQAALAQRGDGEQSRIAVYEDSKGPAAALAQIYDDPSTEPRRFAFISRVDAAKSHSVAGDLYVDKEAGLVSLVVWDSLDYRGTNLVPIMREVIEARQRLGSQTRFVASHQDSKVQSLHTGCWQCALRFVDGMMAQDHHVEQIAGLPDTASNSPVKVMSDTFPAALSDAALKMTSSRTRLTIMLASRLEEVLKKKDANELGDDEYTEELDRAREVVETFLSGRVARVGPDPIDAVPDILPEFNLRIDTLRARDLEAIRDQLEQHPRAFLEAARDLNGSVLRDSVAAGLQQREELAIDEARRRSLPSGDATVPAGSTGDDEAARAPPYRAAYGRFRRTTWDDDDAWSDDEGSMPSLATIVTVPHEEQPPLLEVARRIVERLFEEVEAEARSGREADERRREELAARAEE